MSRNRQQLASLDAMLLCILGFFLSTETIAEQPNILLIVSEDNGPEIGAYGDPYARTPVLDQLAHEGVRFDRAYVPQAGCSQSRAALLTGLYPHQNGQLGLATWKFGLYREDTPNLVRSLKQVGYRTGILGKLHINPPSAFPFDLLKIPSSNFQRKNLEEYTQQAEAFFLAGQRPFFLYVNYPDAHRPFLPRVEGRPERPLQGEDVKPLPYFGLDSPELREQTANYYNCMNRLDSLIGDLLRALQRSGQSGRTLVIYLGDHGADLLRGKRTSYEGGVRVPLIIRWPGQIRTRQVRNELVSTLDLMPTLLTIAKANHVEGLAGRSLVPLLRGEPTGWRQFLYTEFHLHSAHNYFPQRTVRDDRFKLIHNLLPDQTNPGYDFTINRFFSDLPRVIDTAPSVVQQAYRRMRRPPEFELYDLQNDPYEFRNLADDEDHHVKLIELTSRLTEWRRLTHDPLLDSANSKRLQAEIDACFVDGTPRKAQLTLSYPDYFFAARKSEQTQKPAP